MANRHQQSYSSFSEAFEKRPRHKRGKKRRKLLVEEVAMKNRRKTASKKRLSDGIPSEPYYGGSQLGKHWDSSSYDQAMRVERGYEP